RLNARQLQQIVDHRIEPYGVALHHRQRLAQLGRRRGQQILHPPEDQRERRTQLVRHVGEKFVFYLRQRFEPPERFLELLAGEPQLGGALVDDALDLLLGAQKLEEPALVGRGRLLERLVLLLIETAHLLLLPGDVEQATDEHKTERD